MKAAASALTVTAGALAVVSAFGPWSRNGNASSISGGDLADLVLSGTVSGWVPRWIGGALYAVPAGGALAIVGTGLGERSGRVVAVAGALAVAAVALLMGAALGWPRPTELGWGGVAVLASVLTFGLAPVASVVASRRPS